MTRLIAVAVLVGLFPGAWMLPAHAQLPDKRKPPKDIAVSTAREETLALIRMLKQPIDTKGLQEKVKLKTALEHLSNQHGGKLVILVDKEAFSNTLGADAPDPYEEEVILPAFPKMSVDKALRVLLRQIGKGNGTFVLRPGYIEITTILNTVTYGFPYQQTMAGSSFVKRPFAEVLQELSDETGIDIHLDPNIGAKTALPITATFRNFTLEDALVTVTEMARLKYVVFERSIYVTTPEHAKVLEIEEKTRREKRNADLSHGIKQIEPAK